MTETVAGAIRAHRLLLSRLSPKDAPGLRDDHIPLASSLPGWTVGHVLAHLVQNAESMSRLCEEAEGGRVGVQYPGGAAARAANIERGAHVSAEEMLNRLRQSIAHLEDVWSSVRVAWDGSAEMVSGTVVPVVDLPWRRWREVEVHMGDLALGELGCDGPQCWSEEYVRRDVRILTMQWTARGSMGMNTLPLSVARLDDRTRLAWLLGRTGIDGVDPAGLV